MRNPHAQEPPAVHPRPPFNSLFEMPGVAPQRRSRRHCDSLSILYLRCVRLSAWPGRWRRGAPFNSLSEMHEIRPGNCSRLRWDLSILYLRCASACRRATWPDPACAFNSLFEMRYMIIPTDPAHIDAILSILYLRCAWSYPYVALKEKKMLSILYLRCARLLRHATHVAPPGRFQFSI